MKTNIYIIFDVVADETIVIGSAKTDGLFIRQNIPYMEKINPNYRNDLAVFCVGQFVDSDRRLEPSPARPVSWDAYKSPESDEGALRPVK